MSSGVRASLLQEEEEEEEEEEETTTTTFPVQENPELNRGKGLMFF